MPLSLSLALSRRVCALRSPGGGGGRLLKYFINAHIIVFEKNLFGAFPSRSQFVCLQKPRGVSAYSFINIYIFKDIVFVNQGDGGRTGGRGVGGGGAPSLVPS